MRNINTIEQEINKIRLQIYEETKDMTPKQRAERVNRIGEAVAKEYGFKRFANVKEAMAAKEAGINKKV